MRKNIFFVNTYGCPDTANDLEKMFSLMKEYNLSGLQAPYHEIVKLDKNEFKRLLTENQVELICTHVAIHGIFSKDYKDFCNAIEKFKEALEYVNFFGCKYIMPMAFYIEEADSFYDKDLARERLAEGFDIMIKEAEKYGMKVIIENYSQTMLPFSTIEDIEYLTDKVSRLNYCFETGNFVCTKTDTLEAFERLKDRIDMVHVKDYKLCESGGYKCDSGINVEHVDFGKGIAKLERVIKKILCHKPDIPYIIEIHSHSPQKSAIDQACRFMDEIELK